jgi:hypothetical protein
MHAIVRRPDLSGRRQRVTEAIKRELRRRSTVEHVNYELRMGRNHLTHASNVVPAATGNNFRRLLELSCASGYRRQGIINLILMRKPRHAS